MTQKQIRRLRRTDMVDAADKKSVKRLLPYA
jgi:ribosomal protein L35